MRPLRLMAVLMAMACGAALLLRCTGIETTNGITVVASSSSISGNVPPHASVSLFNTAYIPFIDRGISHTVTADESGNFAFDGLVPGKYNVIVTTPDERDAALVPCVKIDTSVIDSQYRAILEPVGSVSGSITNVPDSIAEVLIFLEGTGYYTRIPGAGAFTIDQVSAGSYNLHVSDPSLLENIDRDTANSCTGLEVIVSPDGDTKAGTIVFLSR